MVTDIKNYSFKKSFLQGEVLSIIGEGLERVISAANVFLMLRILNLYEFGVYQLVLAFYTLVTTFSVDSIHEVVTNDLSRNLREQKFSDYKKLFTEYATLRVVLGVITAVIVFLFAEIISQHYGQSVERYLKIIAWLFLFEGFRRPLFSILKTHLYFGIAAGQAVVVALVKLIGFIILLKLGHFNLSSILTVHVAGYFISTILLLGFFSIKLRAAFTPRLLSKTSIIWEMIKRYGKWAVVGEQVSRFTQNVRPWLIKFLINTEAVAIFNLAVSLAGMLASFLPVRTFSSLIPREIQDRERLKFIYRNGVKFISLAGLILAATSFVIFPWIINLILPKYAVSFPYFRLLVFILLPFMGFSVLTRSILVALREQKVLFTRPFFQLIPTLILSFVLIPRLQIWGATLEYALTNMFLAYILYLYLRHLHPELKLSARDLLKFTKTDRVFLKSSLGLIGKEFKLRLRKFF